MVPRKNDRSRKQSTGQRVVIYVLVINIDLIIHYLNIVNDSKAYNVKKILIQLYVMYDPIRPENWGDSDISVFQVFN